MLAISIGHLGSTACLLLRDRGFFLVREQVRDDVPLASVLLCVRAHCLTEYVALIRLEYLLVPQCEQLAVRLHMLSLVQLSLGLLVADLLRLVPLVVRVVLWTVLLKGLRMMILRLIRD